MRRVGGPSARAQLRTDAQLRPLFNQSKRVLARDGTIVRYDNSEIARQVASDGGSTLPEERHLQQGGGHEQARPRRTQAKLLQVRNTARSTRRTMLRTLETTTPREFLLFLSMLARHAAPLLEFE